MIQMTMFAIHAAAASLLTDTEVSNHLGFRAERLVAATIRARLPCESFHTPAAPQIQAESPHSIRKIRKQQSHVKSNLMLIMIEFSFPSNRRGSCLHIAGNRSQGVLDRFDDRCYSKNLRKRLIITFSPSRVPVNLDDRGSV
jgi:hypothetical protein